MDLITDKSDKLIGLLKQNHVNDEGLNSIKNINLKCDIFA